MRLWTVLILSGCLATPVPVLAQETNPDPWEPMNRKTQAFNDWADRWFLRPLASGYTKVVPSPLRTGVSNLFDNLWQPWTAVNQLLQGKGKAAANDSARFVLNLTIGVGGLFDPATAAGLANNQEDLGQTFARWGAGRGPYLVLPILGPSSVRAGIGRLGDMWAFPPRYINDTELRYAVYVLYAIDTRARLLDVDDLISGDRYLFFRDAYLQRRDFLINDGEFVEDPFDDEDWDE